MHVRTNKGKKLVLMSLKDKIRANELLMSHLKPVEGTDTFEYDEGWSDERIATDLGNELAASHVYKVRLSLFGQLKRRMPASMHTPGRINGLESKVTELQNQYELLAVRHLELVDAHNRLIDLLKMNHVVDGRTLKFTADGNPASK